MEAVGVNLSIPGTEGKLVLFSFFFFSRASLAKAQNWGGFLDRQTLRRWDSEYKFRATGTEADLDANHSWGP